MPWRFPYQLVSGAGPYLGGTRAGQQAVMMAMQQAAQADARQETWKKWMSDIAANLLKQGYNEAAKGIYDIIGVPVGELRPALEEKEKGPEVKWKEKTPIGRVPALRQIPVLGELFGAVPQEETVGAPWPQMPERYTGDVGKAFIMRQLAQAGAPVEDIFKEPPAKTFKDETTLRKEYAALPEVNAWPLIDKQMKMLESTWERAQKMKKGDLPKAFNMIDQALIMTFNKILDPGSVVRESEYARTPEGMSWLERLRAWRSRIQAGGILSMNERKEIIEIVKQFREIYRQQMAIKTTQYRGLAKQYGFNPERVAPMFEVNIVPRERQGSKVIVRRGIETTTGRPVVQYSDGSYEYAD